MAVRLHSWKMLYLLVSKHFYLTGINAELLKDEACHVFRLDKHTLQQMHRLYCLLSVHLCAVDCLLDNLLRLDCKLVECHIVISFLFIFSNYYTFSFHKCHTTPNNPTNSQQQTTKRHRLPSEHLQNKSKSHEFDGKMDIDLLVSATISYAKKLVPMKCIAHIYTL